MVVDWDCLILVNSIFNALVCFDIVQLRKVLSVHGLVSYMGAVETVIDGAIADRDSTCGALSSSSGATRRSESSRDRNRASSLVTWLRFSKSVCDFAVRNG
ncbi:zn 2cys6 transcription factor [Colletotrichum asianum]